ncbi:glycosyltransferase [Janibacter sp. LM]|uniref:glycosyltransferase n=1 Tax=Janibacter sp. LM TaxID=3144845 RepID=UPI0031F656BA
MRILQVSKFAHHVGGVETYVGWLVRSLVADGHDVGVVAMTPPPGRSPMDLSGAPTWFTRRRSFEPGSPDRWRSAAVSVWSPEAGVTMRRAIREHRPDIVHFHGTCYQLTSSVVRAVREAGLPAVLTAHEYKLVCANQTLFSDPDGTICTDCVGRSPLHRALAPVRRRCMKGSLAVSVLGAAEQLVSAPQWRRSGPRILAPSDFMRGVIADEGWPAAAVEYLDLPWRSQGEDVLPSDGPRDAIVFASRLVPLKGPHVLLQAWRRIAHLHPEVRVELIGEGSQAGELRSMIAADGIPRVDLPGVTDAAGVRRALDRAIVTAHPSQCHENSPFALRESLMAGVPAVVSRVGGMPEMVGPASGWTVRHDDVDAWAATLDTALRSRLAGSAALVDEVRRRSTTTQEHLARLTAVYGEATHGVRS